MLGIDFFAIGVVACRSFSTKTTAKSKNCFKYKYKWPTKREPTIQVNWTEQQKQIISSVSEGKSVFITGSAGTGKTILVKHLIKLLQKRYKPSKVFVTASTGVAACAISGFTLHSFSGIRYPMADKEILLDRVYSNKEAYKRWKKAEALFIDEISMVDALTFQSLEYIAREIRGVDKIWGGIQLIVGGDFFQLPPVRNLMDDHVRGFAFEADCWNSSFDLQAELTDVFRQSDPHFVKLLNRIRKGHANPEDIQFLEQFFSSTEPDPSVVRLFPMNDDVNRVNADRLAGLGNNVVVYRAVDSGKYYGKKELKQGFVPQEISLCKDARVMLTKNLKPWLGLVNGATGTILSFDDPPKDADISDMCEDGLLPIVKFDAGPTMLIEPETWVVVEGDKVVAERKQLPLLLAWAVSIHKSQGMTLQSLVTDLSKAFDYGMIYVALSRLKSLKGLHLAGLDSDKIKAHPKVLQFYERFLTDH